MDAARFERRAWARRENALDFFKIAADDGGVEAVARDFRMLREEPLGGAVVHPVIAFAVSVMVPAREFEERGDALRVTAIGGCVVAQRSLL